VSWTPGLDAHIRRHGGELLGHGQLILVDIDTPAAADGAPMVNALRWLSDRAVEAGGPPLDLSATVSVRTPGHPGQQAPSRVTPVVPGRSRLPGAYARSRHQPQVPRRHRRRPSTTLRPALIP